MDAPKKMGPAFFLKMIVVLIVAGILTFFVSILAGVDFGKDLRQQEKLTELASKISDELAGGINARILRLGTAPAEGSPARVCGLTPRRRVGGVRVQPGPQARID